MKKIVLLILFFITFIFVPKTNAIGFGVGKIKNHERPILPYADIIEKNNGFYIGKDCKTIYLTFDCGYENGYTKKIIETLKKQDVKASFFITGHYLETSLDLVNLMITNGNLVCNHTYSHKHFTKESNDEMLNDIKRLEDSYESEIGYKMEKIVRPPAGEFDERSLKFLKENGYRTVFWSLAYQDWFQKKYYKNHYSYNNVMEKIHDGAIILMHTVSKDNMVDLEDIIVSLKEKGFSFGLVNEL